MVYSAETPPDPKEHQAWIHLKSGMVFEWNETIGAWDISSVKQSESESVQKSSS